MTLHEGEFLQSVLQKLDDFFALDLDDKEAQVAAADRIIGEMRIADPTCTSPVAQYTIGYVAYHHPEHEHSAELHHVVEHSFAMSVSLVPDAETEARAWLYLGHSAYDQKRYQLAHRRFRKCDQVALGSYLASKCEEMKLCISIHLNGLSASLQSFEEFVAFLGQVEMEDICPQELARVVTERTEVLSSDEYSRLMACAERLDQMGLFSAWFTGLALAYLPIPSH